MEYRNQFGMIINMMINSTYYVYIISNARRTTFYIGVTNDLTRRMYEHKNGLIEGFSKKYNLKELVYYEECSDIGAAIAREKQLKNWHRDWKINLIKTMNPQMKELPLV
ncbi:MAG: GIY-YIG nuclease family protein [Patescibacteria group bacterium]|nr:GIY-YIG nuclease family protein [Patescibacteria group bacterium]